MACQRASVVTLASPSTVGCIHCYLHFYILHLIGTLYLRIVVVHPPRLVQLNLDSINPFPPFLSLLYGFVLFGTFLNFSL